MDLEEKLPENIAIRFLIFFWVWDDSDKDYSVCNIYSLQYWRHCFSVMSDIPNDKI